MSCEKGDMDVYSRDLAEQLGTDASQMTLRANIAYRNAVQAKDAPYGRGGTLLLDDLMGRSGLRLLRPSHMRDNGMPGQRAMQGYAAFAKDLAMQGALPPDALKAIADDETQDSEKRIAAAELGMINNGAIKASDLSLDAAKERPAQPPDPPRLARFNSDSADQIARSTGLDQAVAERIVQARAERPFSSESDVWRRVEGLSQSKMQSLRGTVDLTESDEPPVARQLDREGSGKVAKLTRADTSRCWANSVRAMRSKSKAMRALIPEGSVYVEGWALLIPEMPMPFEHGWIETPDGRIIDPTEALKNDRWNCGAQSYFPGVKYSREQLGEATGIPPFVRQHGGSGMRIPEYKASHDAAYIASFGVTPEQMFKRSGTEEPDKSVLQSPPPSLRQSAIDASKQIGPASAMSDERRSAALVGLYLGRAGNNFPDAWFENNEALAAPAADMLMREILVEEGKTRYIPPLDIGGLYLSSELDSASVANFVTSFYYDAKDNDLTDPMQQAGYLLLSDEATNWRPSTQSDATEEKLAYFLTRAGIPAQAPDDEYLPPWPSSRSVPQPMRPRPPSDLPPPAWDSTSQALVKNWLGSDGKWLQDAMRGNIPQASAYVADYIGRGEVPKIAQTTTLRQNDVEAINEYSALMRREYYEKLAKSMRPEGKTTGLGAAARRQIEQLATSTDPLIAQADTAIQAHEQAMLSGEATCDHIRAEQPAKRSGREYDAWRKRAEVEWNNLDALLLDDTPYSNKKTLQQQQAREVTSPMLSPTLPHTYDVRSAMGKDSAIAPVAQQGFDFVSRFMHPSQTADTSKLQWEEKAGRAAYYPTNQTITLDPEKTEGAAKIAIHELGHWLEDRSPAIRSLVKEFAQARTAGQPRQRMSDLDSPCYGEHEVARFGAFRMPYTGRVYPNEASEIISTGLEWMYENPVAFAREDPEHFDLMVRISKIPHATRTE